MDTMKGIAQKLVLLLGKLNYLEYHSLQLSPSEKSDVLRESYSMSQEISEGLGRLLSQQQSLIEASAQSFRNTTYVESPPPESNSTM